MEVVMPRIDCAGINRLPQKLVIALSVCRQKWRVNYFPIAIRAPRVGSTRPRQTLALHIQQYWQLRRLENNFVESRANLCALIFCVANRVKEMGAAKNRRSDKYNAGIPKPLEKAC